MKTTYDQELEELLTQWYTPVSNKDDATDTTVKKSLHDIHTDVTNVLPSKWVNQQDVYSALQKAQFKAFPTNTDDESSITFLYYLEPKQ